MIDKFLSGEDWDEAHPDMNIEEGYGELLATVARLATELGADNGPPTAASSSAARRLLVRAPAIVNVLLNYKICAEHGLPFHPTVYYELAEARRYRYPHSIEKLEEANRLYRASIDLARSAYALREDCDERIKAFTQAIPAELLEFVYTGTADKYTWRASEPAKVKALAAAIDAAGKPGLIVAAAHGSIMPALLLAEYLELPLYFVRFSMFKRKDEAPIISLADEAWLAAHGPETALLFDEDVAGGSTLSRFRDSLRPFFHEAKTACVIRHAGASIRPDFTGRVWFD